MPHLHYWPTLNGKKVMTFLEEAGLEYRAVPCNIGRGDQSYALLRRFGDEVDRIYGC